MSILNQIAGFGFLDRIEDPIEGMARRTVAQAYRAGRRDVLAEVEALIASKRARLIAFFDDEESWALAEILDDIKQMPRQSAGDASLV